MILCITDSIGILSPLTSLHKFILVFLNGKFLRVWHYYPPVYAILGYIFGIQVS